jgi:hypothetical protein
VEVSKESSLALFAVLLNLKGNSQSIELSTLTTGTFNYNTRQKNNIMECAFSDLFEELALAQEIAPAELFERHGADTLTPIPSTIPIWTEHCAFKNIFMAFVHGSGTIFYQQFIFVNFSCLLTTIGTGIGPLLPLVGEILVSWGKNATTGVDLADMLRVSMPILSWKFLESCNIDHELFLKNILFGKLKKKTMRKLIDQHTD